MVKKTLILSICYCIAVTAYADKTAIYETKNAQGVPTFSNVPTPDKSQAKKIIIETQDPQPIAQVPVVESTAQTPTEQIEQVPAQPVNQIPNVENFGQNNHTVGQQADQDRTKLQKLKQQWEQAQAMEQQSLENLQKAKKSMEDGTYTVGGDQFINQDYLANLQESHNIAKQNTAVAQAAYEQQRKKLK